jgi:chromate transporter
MNLLVLYLLLLKATATSFSGLTSLPVLREDLVVRRRVLTDRELNAAVAAVQMSPGPNGAYVVSVGYFIAGFPGAVCGWLAMITPAFLIFPMLRYAGRRAEAPRVRSAVNAVTLAAAGLIVSSAIPLARQAISGRGAAAIAAASCGVAVLTRVDTLWVILGAALAALGFGYMGW